MSNWKEKAHETAMKGLKALSRKRKRADREDRRKWEREHATVSPYKDGTTRLLYTPMGNKR